MILTDLENLGIQEFLSILSKDTSLSLGKDGVSVSVTCNVHTFPGITLTFHLAGGGKRDDLF